MRVLVSEGASQLANILIPTLLEEHQVRVACTTGAIEPDPPRLQVVDADLKDTQAAWRAVRGMDAVVLTGAAPEALPEDELARDRALLDAATRGTHSVCQAAVDAGLRRIVYCGTLELFNDVPDDRYVSEHRRPQPGTEMRVLSRHLAEQVTREFARERAVTVTVLRLGRLVCEDEVEPGTAPDLMWLDPRDAAAAVALALGRDESDRLNWSSRWAVRHVCAEPPHPKFLLQGIRGMGFEPRHNFAGAWAAAESGAA